MQVQAATVATVLFLVAVSSSCASLVPGEVRYAPANAPGFGRAASTPLATQAQPSRLGSQLAPFEQDEPEVLGSELSIWSEPGFRRKFLESYLSETEIEPAIHAEERKPLEKILELIAAGQDHEALKLLKAARNPASSAAFDFLAANIHFQREQFDQAAQAYTLAIEKHPKYRRAWKNLAMIHVRESNFQQALPALTKVIELGGGDSVTYGLLGFAFSNTGQDLPAESAYRQANLLDPQAIDWKMGMARSFFRQQRFADAAALCAQLLNENPNRADLWALQANAHIGMQQPLRAAESFEVLDRMGASTPDTLNMLGDIYVNEGLFDLSVDCYARAMQLSPDVAPDRAIRAAKVLIARGAHEETASLMQSIDTLRGSSLSDSDRKELLRLRARAAVACGSGEEEARVLEEVVALDPLDGDALILLGQHHERMGDADRAVLYFERAAGLEAFEVDAKVRHAQLLVRQGRYADAIPLLKRAQSLKPRENIQKFLEDIERASKSR
jgi:tetratricopeptide (TPR) repeat protein